MLVLDLVRQMDGRFIEIAPFHTGHLGLLPGTVVYPTLLVNRDRDDRAELIITPFKQEVHKMARLTCVMHDVPGAVQRLANAVAALGINIDIQESGSINAFHHHVVTMILDWSSTWEYNQEHGESVTEGTRRRYNIFRKLFPVDQKRYVKLFESIIATCADVLEWEEIAGLWIPNLSIQPIHEMQPRKEFDRITVEESPRKNYRVRIELSETIVDALHPVLRPGKPSWYLVLSDVYQRAARVLFIAPEFEARLVHVGFQMKDKPGALAAVLEVLARANFNIVTSTHRHLRRQTEDSVWDVLVECPDMDLSRTDPYARVEWLAERLQMIVSDMVREASPATVTLQECRVALGQPQYPAPGVRMSPKLLATDIGALTRYGSQTRSKESERDGAIRQQVARLLEKLDSEDEREASQATAVLRLVNQELTEGENTVVFLSYPANAKLHGSTVREALLKIGYRVDEYQVKDGEKILDQVADKIRKCDYLLGIWHHEDGLQGGVSPWMPFEYGMAVALGKRCHVVCSSRLSVGVRNRINPGTANPTYDDGTFLSKSVPAIVEYCRRHFTLQRHARKPGDR